jgi:type VI secretion system secreted protein VgrG
MGNYLGVQVSVYSVDSFGVPTGGPLAVQDVPGAEIAGLASGGPLSVVFSTPATVAAGTPYAFVVEVLGATGEGLNLGLDWVAPAPDKLGIVTENYAASFFPTQGIAFTTFVDGGGTPPGGGGGSGGGSGGEELADTGFAPSVPLAVAFAMLVAGAALVVSRRTRRQHSTALGG